MEKPVTIQIDELKKDLVEIFNSSNLPVFILEFILKDIYTEIRSVCQLQLEKDTKDYNESLKNDIDRKETDE